MKDITPLQLSAWNFQKKYHNFGAYYKNHKARYKSDYTGNYDLVYCETLKTLRNILKPIYFDRIKPIATLNWKQHMHLVMQPMQKVYAAEMLKPNVLLDMVKKDHDFVGASLPIPIIKKTPTRS